jgi:hypothetical protein
LSWQKIADEAHWRTIRFSTSSTQSSQKSRCFKFLRHFDSGSFCWQHSKWTASLKKIGKPLDRSEWGMTPPTVNAYEDPQTNTITLPAGTVRLPIDRVKNRPFVIQTPQCVENSSLGYWSTNQRLRWNHFGHYASQSDFPQKPCGTLPPAKYALFGSDRARMN